MPSISKFLDLLIQLIKKRGKPPEEYLVIFEGLP